ncbi:TolC family protein [Terriglobus aquaticus]|uniref:TolC family protein n=1 Tax=Terriglobus aquaticus TaxID=940139 RepID=A0ABW9KNY7_9BACT|nr:TolC family protein [Terriglobus aquaticus]
MIGTTSQRLMSLLALFVLPLPAGVAAAQAAVQPQTGQQPPAAPQPRLALPTSVPLTIPHERNPFRAYLPTAVPPANLANSPRLDALVHNGVLEISLSDAIVLALENNLDLAIARYNIPIAEADIQRTKAGGITRGVNTGVVQNTPGGGGVGAFGSAGAGAGAGGTSGGAGGAGTGASGLVQSTLGTGTAVNSYDPIITGQIGLQHSTEPLSNLAVNGVPTLRSNAWAGSFGYNQAFATGTSVQFSFNANRQTTNSIYTFLNPQLNSQYQVQIQQPLLAGSGLGPNLRYLRIARNNKLISDEAFELQVISTVTQTANLYWDLVAAYEDEQVKERSLDFANSTLTSARQQLQLQAIPGLDVTKDEGEVARAEGDLTIAKSTLQFQELLMKNALTKNLDDPILESMPVRPTDLSSVSSASVPEMAEPTQEAINSALERRIELRISSTNLHNRDISRKAVNNNLLPSLNLVANYGGLGLAGVSNPAAGITSTSPVGFGSSVENAFNNSAPNYFVGLNLDIPIRNRQAKSDQYRSELETRQAEILLQQQRKQIRIEVRNAQYALAQAAARVTAAAKARDIAAQTFDIMGKEQQLGAGSALDTLQSRQALATAESLLVAARTAYQKARVELQRAIGTTLAENHVSVESARSGVQPASVSQRAPDASPRTGAQASPAQPQP